MPRKRNSFFIFEKKNMITITKAIPKKIWEFLKFFIFIGKALFLAHFLRKNGKTRFLLPDTFDVKFSFI